MDPNETVIKKIGELQGKIEEGFSGIHSRQDRANSGIEKAHTRINELDKIIEVNRLHIGTHRKEKNKWMDRIVNTLFTAGLIVVLWILIATGIVSPPL